eukprot:gnl/Chilomastix_cuspidata/2463.p1 GENE.gnl/Chilomastix_cuspidata/2463~~gnl/Chilomastix_cuspidata/2463.p1  ORF type:complete len:577 (-),score=168.45 gnl/Chilomastix_cuspidata/2463:216-1946(-)
MPFEKSRYLQGTEAPEHNKLVRAKKETNNLVFFFDTNKMITGYSSLAIEDQRENSYRLTSCQITFNEDGKVRFNTKNDMDLNSIENFRDYILVSSPEQEDKSPKAASTLEGIMHLMCDAALSGRSTSLPNPVHVVAKCMRKHLGVSMSDLYFLFPSSFSEIEIIDAHRALYDGGIALANAARQGAWAAEVPALMAYEIAAERRPGPRRVAVVLRRQETIELALLSVAREAEELTVKHVTSPITIFHGTALKKQILRRFVAAVYSMGSCLEFRHFYFAQMIEDHLFARFEASLAEARGDECQMADYFPYMEELCYWLPQSQSVSINLFGVEFHVKYTSNGPRVPLEPLRELLRYTDSIGAFASFFFSLSGATLDDVVFADSSFQKGEIAFLERAGCALPFNILTVPFRMFAAERVFRPPCELRFLRPDVVYYYTPVLTWQSMCLVPKHADSMETEAPDFFQFHMPPSTDVRPLQLSAVHEAQDRIVLSVYATHIMCGEHLPYHFFENNIIRKVGECHIALSEREMEYESRARARYLIPRRDAFISFDTYWMGDTGWVNERQELDISKGDMFGGKDSM